MTSGLKTEIDLLNWPDNDKRHELVAGVIVEEQPPTVGHDRVRRAIELPLREFVSERKLGKVFGRIGFVLAKDPDTVRGPDISFVRLEKVEGADPERYFPFAPELAVIILSLSITGADVRAKLEDYFRAGCRLVWVVDSRDGTATEYRSLESSRSIRPDGALDGEDVLPGFSLPLTSIFSEL